MVTLKDFALNHKSKRELTDLKEIDVTKLDIKEDVFTNAQGQPIKYNFIEIEGYKYTLNAKNLSALKSILQARPSCTKVQYIKTDTGVMCVPLD